MVEGATLIVRGPHSEISAPSLIQLAEAAAHGPVAPLWLGWDGAVASAGLGVHDGLPFHLLSGAPSEDAFALGPEIFPWRRAGMTFAHRAGDASKTHRTLTTVVVRAPASDDDLDQDASGIPDTDIEPLVAQRGWRVSHWGPSGPAFARNPASVTLADGSRVPSLRWALKIAAPPGRPGEAWGDTHFARGLAGALRRRGQEVVIDAYAARNRSTTGLDDVSLALRGPEHLEPQADALSLLWVISHPDEIAASDVAGFDAVFAASEKWADETSRAWARPILPLLQCTDAARFRPQGTLRTNRFVFVGTARGIARPSVVEPVRAGLPVDVYGPDWRGYIPSAVIRAEGVPNDQLPRLYEGARAVLNDHWPAMQRHGFVSNRLFDVVAAGGRAVSDDVAGIAELFHGAVATYRSVPEMLRILEHDLDDVLPDDRSLEAISASVRRDHSFDARADTLLRTAIELRR
ncbi:CgeB family protein [Microbacterium sp. SL75]|uniref:CgeB family protein n=1 Tax=Microbacterium sp. SL75 TaxID=2995140 RepID=UPI0022719204|nr:glycosyltransferase [Microbacterium sp. SL75]WAC67902.1 glycosyltransferase [Microbacterium sp. SL75]